MSRAVENGHEAVVKLLLEKGGDVDSKNKDGKTTLLRNPPTKKNPTAEKITLAKDRVPATERSIDELEEQYERIARRRSEGLVHRDPKADAGLPSIMHGSSTRASIFGDPVRRHREVSETSITRVRITSQPDPARNSTSGTFAVLKSILR